MLIPVLLLWFSAQTPTAVESDRPKLCAVAGQVTNAVTGEPVAGASITLRRNDAGVSYGTATDAAGKFAMKNIGPGKYNLLVQRNLFLSGQYGERAPGRQFTPLVLEPGQEVRDITIRLMPQSVIAGRVTDDKGEPLMRVRIAALKMRYRPGGKELELAGDSSTNDLGEYRIFDLAPGRYYVRATYGNPGSGNLDGSAIPVPDESYVPIWYPGVPDPPAAASIDLSGGGVTRTIDFTLSKVRTVRVSGKVKNNTPAPNSRIMVWLTPRGGFGSGSSAWADPQGNFTVRGVIPGSYTIRAEVWEGQRTNSVRQAVEVGATGLDNLSLAIMPRTGMEVSGQVKVEGAGEPPSLAAVEVRLMARDPDAAPATGSARADGHGAFRLTDVEPGEYDLWAWGFPEGYYIKSVRQGDEEALEKGLDLTRGSAPVTVVLAPGAGEVTGVVQDNKQTPSPGATVVLLPVAQSHRLRLREQNTMADQNGRYTFKNIDPGDYKLFAWEDVEPGAWSDPDFMKPFETKGVAVTIREHGRESVPLDVIPAAQR